MKTYGMEKSIVKVYECVKLATTTSNKDHGKRQQSQMIYRDAFSDTKNHLQTFLSECAYSDVAIALTGYLVAKREDVQERWDRRRLKREMMENINYTAAPTRRMKI